TCAPPIVDDEILPSIGRCSSYVLALPGSAVGGPLAVRAWGYVAGASVVAAGAAALLIAHQLPKSALEARWSMIDRYCSDCHDDSESAAGLSFDKRRPDNVHADPGTWEKVLHQVSIGAMPPRDKPQPAPEMLTAFVNALEGALDAQAEAKPDVGTTTVRR